MPRFDMPGVRVQRLGTDRGKTKTRQVIMDLAVPVPGIVYTHNNSLPNILRGLGERLYKVKEGDAYVDPPKPVRWDLDYYADLVVRKMPKFSEPITRDEFVALYNGPKQKRYAAAARSLSNRDLQPKDWEVKLFIKDEKILSWAKNDPAPRLISPRSPEYCMELGRYIKPIEHLLYKAVARVWGETTIAKGLNFNQRGELIAEKWRRYNNPVAVSLDASRFDQHVSVDALKWEHSVYRKCYPGSKRLPSLLAKQLINNGVAYVDDCKISYSVAGSRMSGDMNTAVGNCLIMTGLVHAYARYCGVQCSLINDGDDCVVFMESDMLELFQANLQSWFRDHGFTMKVEGIARHLEEVEFCQCHPVFNGVAYTMCRNVTKALFTDAVHVGRTVEEIKAIRHDISVNGQVWSKGLPVFGAFYRFLDCAPPKRSTFLGDYYHSGTRWLAKGCVTGTSYITPQARLSFARAFGIQPAEQVAIEQFYAGLPRSSISAPHNALIEQCYEPAVLPEHYPLFVSDSLLYLVFNGQE